MAVPQAASSLMINTPVPQGGLPAPAAFLGVKLHLLTMEQTVAQVMLAMRRRSHIQQVSLNVAKLMTLRRDAELAADLMQADLVSADGMGIVIGARLLGLPVPERVTGVDLMDRVLERCAEQGLRPYFLGARPEVLARAMTRLKQRFPMLHVAGFQDGYYTPLQEAGVVRKIRAAQPDCLFVGMPTPRKERFLARHRAALQIPFVMGVGGSLDIMAGHVRRAPRLWQRCGLEWLYRIVQEPRRMWRRYLTTNLMFAGVLAGALVEKALLRTGLRVQHPHRRIALPSVTPP